jgi:mono/diheme cytochrome c family protein
MRRRLYLLLLPAFAAAGLGAWLLQAPAPAADVARSTAADAWTRDGAPFLARHCTACHGEKKPKADLALHVYRDEQAVLKDRKHWDAVVKMVQSGQMPPETRPRPQPAEVDAFVKALAAVFERADRSARRDPGRVTVRRLNRVEYTNTVRDLTSIDFDPAEDFPADDIGYGFDNIGDVLSLSPLLMERYLAAAEAIATRAVLTEKPPPPTRRVAANFLQPRTFGRDIPRRSLYARDEVVFTNRHVLADDGEYTLRMRGSAFPQGDTPVRFALTDNDKEVKEFEVKTPPTPGKPVTFDVRLPMKKGEHRVGVKMLSDFKRPDPPPEGQTREQRRAPTRAPGVHVFAIDLEGPMDYWPEGHRRILACPPDLPKQEQTRIILDRFASRAYRRPAMPAEVEHLVRLVDAAQARGEKWEAGIQLALQAVLVSPKFLFRLELDDRPDSRDTHPLDDYQLAARLAYFLCSSCPDDELTNLAAKHQLGANLEGQVRRLLTSPRAKAFVENFAFQWLQLRNLKTFTPDPKLFPDFDERLRAAMLKETELFFAAILREDRSILDLLDADFTYVNGRLAKHYGISGVYGEEFQRVKLSDGVRGGLLAQASILTVTSNPTRTSPVKRGKWVLEQILGTPPPDPPPNVPELPVDEKAQLTGSLRQRMEQHRANPNCAVCHTQMDAMGFAFENFNAIGAFRAKDGNFPIDPSGTLPGGLSFRGPAELKTILRGKKELFARCLTEKMLTYALGRGLEPYDRPTVEAITMALARNDYRFSTLVLEIVKSEPFRMRRGNGGQS